MKIKLKNHIAALALLLIVGLATATSPSTNLGGYVDTFETVKICEDGSKIELSQTCPEDKISDPFFSSVLSLIDRAEDNLK